MTVPFEKAWALLKFDDAWGDLTDAERDFKYTVEDWGTPLSPQQYMRSRRPEGVWDDYGGLKQIALAELPKGSQVQRVDVAEEIDPTNLGPQEGRHRFHRGRKIPEEGPVLERGWHGEDKNPYENPPKMRREDYWEGNDVRLENHLTNLEGDREHIAGKIKWMLDHSYTALHGIKMEQWRRNLEEVDKEISLARKKLEDYYKRFPEVPHYERITAEHMARPSEPETKGSLFLRAWSVLKREEPIERDTLKEVKRLRRDMGKLIRVKKRGKAEARP